MGRGTEELYNVSSAGIFRAGSTSLSIPKLFTSSAILPLYLLLRAETCTVMVNVLTDFIINLAVVNSP
jgi:hypothetical protein